MLGSRTSRRCDAGKLAPGTPNTQLSGRVAVAVRQTLQRARDALALRHPPACLGRSHLLPLHRVHARQPTDGLLVNFYRSLVTRAQSVFLIQVVC